MDNIGSKSKVGVVQRCCKWPSAIFLLLLIIVAMRSSVVLGDDHENMINQRQTEAIQNKMPIIDAAKRLFSDPRPKFKTLFQRGWSYFHHPPPNLDFRGGSGSGDDESTTGNEGAGVKVKEAAVTSLDKSKAAVEDSAKSAAKFAEDAVEKTVKKLKKTLSGKADHEAEL